MCVFIIIMLPYLLHYVHIHMLSIHRQRVVDRERSAGPPSNSLVLVLRGVLVISSAAGRRSPPSVPSIVRRGSSLIRTLRPNRTEKYN